MKDQPSLLQNLEPLFDDYYNRLHDKDSEVITVQYIFAYEKDPMCGVHLFQPKVCISFYVAHYFTLPLRLFSIIVRLLTLSFTFHGSPD